MGRKVWENPLITFELSGGECGINSRKLTNSIIRELCKFALNSFERKRNHLALPLSRFMDVIAGHYIRLYVTWNWSFGAFEVFLRRKALIINQSKIIYHDRGNLSRILRGSCHFWWHAKEYGVLRVTRGKEKQEEKLLFAIRKSDFYNLDFNDGEEVLIHFEIESHNPRLALEFLKNEQALSPWTLAAPALTKSRFFNVVSFWCCTERFKASHSHVSKGKHQN